MSAKLKLNNNVGGSTSLVCDDSQTQDLELKVFSNDIASRVLSGTELTAVGIVGANPQATLWANGDITGSSDNGSFTKSANGTLDCYGDFQGDSSITTGFAGGYRSGAILITFPIVLIEAVAASVLSKNPTDAFVGNVYSADYLTEMNVHFARVTSDATVNTLYGSYILKGEWK